MGVVSDVTRMARGWLAVSNPGYVVYNIYGCSVRGTFHLMASQATILNMHFCTQENSFVDLVKLKHTIKQGFRDSLHGETMYR